MSEKNGCSRTSIENNYFPCINPYPTIPYHIIPYIHTNISVRALFSKKSETTDHKKVSIAIVAILSIVQSFIIRCRVCAYQRKSFVNFRILVTTVTIINRTRKKKEHQISKYKKYINTIIRYTLQNKTQHLFILLLHNNGIEFWIFIAMGDFVDICSLACFCISCSCLDISDGTSLLFKTFSIRNTQYAIRRPNHPSTFLYLMNTFLYLT